MKWQAPWVFFLPHRSQTGTEEADNPKYQWTQPKQLLQKSPVFTQRARKGAVSQDWNLLCKSQSSSAKHHRQKGGPTQSHQQRPVGGLDSTPPEEKWVISPAPARVVSEEAAQSQDLCPSTGSWVHIPSLSISVEVTWGTVMKHSYPPHPGWF